MGDIAAIGDGRNMGCPHTVVAIQAVAGSSSPPRKGQASGDLKNIRPHTSMETLMSKTRVGRFTLIGAGLAIAGAAIAGAAATFDISVIIVPDIVSGNESLTVTTNEMPKGWYTEKGGFDRSKSNVAVTINGDATQCSTSKSGGTLNSVSDGTFTAQLNPAGKPDAYVWSATKDLSSMQNHWYWHQHCDGTTEKHGCDAAINVSVTATVYDKVGAVRTNEDGSPATATKSATLPAVQDADVVETGCQTEGPSCKLDGQVFGACQSSCEANANAQKQAAQDAEKDCAKGNDGNSCRAAAREAARQADVANSACECTCKLQQLPVTCPQAQHCAADD